MLRFLSGMKAKESKKRGERGAIAGICSFNVNITLAVIKRIGKFDARLLKKEACGGIEHRASEKRAFQLGGDFRGDITISTDTQTVYLRGYPQNAFRGQKAALGSLEYRFPIKNIEHGWGVRPVFFERLHGAVFYDAGNAWDGAFHASDLKRSVGAEVRLDMMLGYLILPATLRVGIAVGLDEKGEAIPIFGLLLPLEL